MCDEKPPCKQITTLHTYKTEFNADSVEWCPHEPHQNLFVCGNYQLKDGEKRERFGCILLFSVTENDLILHQSVPTAAVLDQKWCHNKIDNCSILGVANAQGTLEIYALRDNLKLELLTSYQLADDGSETLFLSLDWSSGKYGSNEPDIVCSDSKGTIHRFKLKNNALVKEDSWHGHDYEAWIGAFYYWDPNIVFSGGDDCRFLKFDRRVGDKAVSCNRSHEAGVTSMHSNTRKEFELATGRARTSVDLFKNVGEHFAINQRRNSQRISRRFGFWNHLDFLSPHYSFSGKLDDIAAIKCYDTNIRLWDIRHLKTYSSSITTPGPLWRLKWDPYDQNYLLAACMLGGVHIITQNSNNLEIIDSYYEHENIAYGADWSHLPITPTVHRLIASCSFYDNLLCVSRVKL